jgi:hypothetical protein
MTMPEQGLSKTTNKLLYFVAVMTNRSRYSSTRPGDGKGGISKQREKRRGQNKPEPAREKFSGRVFYRDTIIGRFQMDVLHIPKVQGRRQFNLNTWTWVDLWNPALSPSGTYMQNLVASGEVIKERLAQVGVTLAEEANQT